MSDLTRLMKSALLLLSGGLAFAQSLQAESIEDPMRPPDASVYSNSTKKTVSYHLSSIRISATHRSAIINGKIVGIGDRVGNARVTEIQGNEVKLSIAGRTRTLSLLPLSIKKPAEASRQ